MFENEVEIEGKVFRLVVYKSVLDQNGLDT